MSDTVITAIKDAIDEHADEDGYAPLGDVVDEARKNVPESAEDVHDALAELKQRGEVYAVDYRIATTDGGVQ